MSRSTPCTSDGQDFAGSGRDEGELVAGLRAPPPATSAGNRPRGAAWAPGGRERTVGAAAEEADRGAPGGPAVPAPLPHRLCGSGWSTPGFRSRRSTLRPPYARTPGWTSSCRTSRSGRCRASLPSGWTPCASSTTSVGAAASRAVTSRCSTWASKARTHPGRQADRGPAGRHGPLRRGKGQRHHAGQGCRRGRRQPGVVPEREPVALALGCGDPWWLHDDTATMTSGASLRILGQETASSPGSTSCTCRSAANRRSHRVATNRACGPAAAHRDGRRRPMHRPHRRGASQATTSSAAPRGTREGHGRRSCLGARRVGDVVMRAILGLFLTSVVALAGCGSADRPATKDADPSLRRRRSRRQPRPRGDPSADAGEKGRVIKTAGSDYGQMLFDSAGQAIYLFDKQNDQRARPRRPMVRRTGPPYSRRNRGGAPQTLPGTTRGWLDAGHL